MLTEMVIAQDVSALGNPERGQWGPSAVWSEPQVAFRASYGLPEVVDGITRD